jgi:hypothetical protein
MCECALQGAKKPLYYKPASVWLVRKKEKIPYEKGTAFG